MNTIIVNGKKIQVSGNNITVVNDKVYVDGNLIEEGLSGEVTIKFEGDLANLKSDKNVTVVGTVKGNIDAKGSVNCNDVYGDVTAGGSVNCDNVGKNVSAGGSVNCDNIGGNVIAGGSVKRF